jgi:hypothetical protein
MKIDEIIKPNKYEPIEKEDPKCVLITKLMCEEYALRNLNYKSETKSLKTEFSFICSITRHLSEFQISIG